MFKIEKFKIFVSKVLQEVYIQNKHNIKLLKANLHHENYKVGKPLR